MPTNITERVNALRAVARRPGATIAVSPRVVEAAHRPADQVLASLGTTPQGLTDVEAQARLATHGPNEVARQQRHVLLEQLKHTVANPLVVLLTVLASVAFATDDVRAGIVMSLMVVLGVGLRFIQESRADAAAARLKGMISVTATVLRDGASVERPLRELVPGDVVRLAAGDMIPADVRLLAAKDLFVIQASLTGESLPVEKDESFSPTGAQTGLQLPNVCFLGTSIESGAATAVVVATGTETYIGRMAGALAVQAEPTSFDLGINRFTWLMIRFILVMVPAVFLLNALTKHDVKEAFFFSLAVAVGLTPEMLPMIVSVCLSRGAMAMSRKKVIVKRLNAIQNFGAMDVLCTDKTGTLTLDRVILEWHCNVLRKEDDEVLAEAYRISHFQTGLKNALDRAILEHKALHHELEIESWERVDEIPFDFSRRVMSVVVEPPAGQRRLLAKGAPEEIFRRCSHFELEGELFPIEPILIQDLRQEYESLSEDGFRVLAVAYKNVEARPAYSKADECDLVLRGYVAFLDPPKETATPAIAALQRSGVAVKILTGDNALVSCKVCHEVGLPTDRMLVGSDIEALSDEALAEAAEKTTLFARLSPADKQRIIRALRARGHVVGFLGDGINDAPALKSADVGISVDTAVDVAKESADLILLEKSLMVLEEGVLEGRKVFANILKYIRMGASSNFGNMFSVLGASAFLPFVPMAPIQVLTNNLLYDFSQVPIPTDNIDAEQVLRPRPWRIDEIRRFILCIGPVSSIFDYTTYFVMLYVFGCWNPARASLFQTGWFVESLMTQTLIIHVIRTRKIPFLQSRASLPLTLTSLAVMGVGAWLPYSPLGPALGMVPLPHLYWPILALTLTSYGLLTHAVKMWLIRKGWL